MAKKLQTLDDASVDPVEAVKRAFIRRGKVPKSRRTPNAPAKHTPANKDSKISKIPTPNPDPAALAHPAEAPEKLVDLTANSHEVLLEVSTVFPFTLVPDTVTIDREKITIANRMFIQVAKIASVPIVDIQSIEASVGPFFGSISLLRMNMAPMPRPLKVKMLWREDAVKVQRIIQGYIIAIQKKIDCSSIEKDDLITLLNDLGQGVSD